MDEEQREELDAEATAFEEMVEAAVTATFAAAVAEAVRQFLARFHDLTTDALRVFAGQVFGRIQPDMAATLSRLAGDGIAVGVRQAERVARETIPVPSMSLTDKALIQVIRTIDTRAFDRLSNAVRLAQTLPLDTLGDAATIAGSASSAVNGARSDARWSANRSIGEGVVKAARSAGARLVWVPERNACLQCMAYAGETIEPGELFPVGLTFGSSPSKLGGVPYPPLHPNCRCRAQFYVGPDAQADRSAGDVASVLKREAERSVARGLSDYDSEPARLRAADKLLKAGSLLPPTVIRRAERDVGRKKFTPRPR